MKAEGTASRQIPPGASASDRALAWVQAKNDARNQAWRQLDKIRTSGNKVSITAIEEQVEESGGQYVATYVILLTEAGRL